VDSRHEILAFADDRQLLWVLLPSALKVVVKDGLAEAVEDARGNDISLDVLFFEI